IDNLKIDTNRDGIDIDACRNVRISNCTVNSPFDDSTCRKSSYALGVARATENVTITNCQVSGYDEGTLLGGTFKREYNATVSIVPLVASNLAQNQTADLRTLRYRTVSLTTREVSRLRP